MKTNELELFISRVERGITGIEDAQWFRQWLQEQPGYQYDVWTALLATAAIMILLVLAVAR